MSTRPIVRLNHEGKMIHRYDSIPIAANLLKRKQAEIKWWARNPQLIREQSRWMYEKDFLRVCNENGCVPDLAFDLNPTVDSWNDSERKRLSEIRKQEERHRRGRKRTGTIYTELHNRGQKRNSGGGNSVSSRPVKGVGLVQSYKYRWVAEIMYHGKRYRCRSSRYETVRAWLDEMISRFS